VFAAAIEDAEGFPITAMPISPSELFELRQTAQLRGYDKAKSPDDVTAGQLSRKDDA